MKANELMIGNLLKWKEQPGFNDEDRNMVLRVKNIFDDAIKIDGRFELYHISLFEPIPLTPEILEKNGFKPYIPENHLETVYAYQDVSKAVANELYALWPYQDGSFYLLLRVDGKDMVRMNIHYVHQLQHALRLCGIEKEIVL